MTIAINEMMAAMAVFISQREVFYRERKARLYDPTAYWVGKQLALFPYQLFFPGIWIFCIYWVAGFQTEWYKFGVFFGMLESVAFVNNSAGLLFGALLPPTISTVIGPVVVLVSAMVAGFLRKLNNMSAPFFGISFASFARWSYECLVINEFTGLEFTCTPDEQATNGSCPYDTGEEYIDSLGFADLDLFLYMVFLLGTAAILRIILWFILRYFHPTR